MKYQLKVNNRLNIIELVQRNKDISFDQMIKLLKEIDNNNLGFLVNLDEFSKAGNSQEMDKILTTFASLLCSGHSVYVIVSGLYNREISKAITFSGLERVNIVLKPLEMKHCNQILKTFYDYDISDNIIENNATLQYLLWLGGGIPGYYSFLFTVFAKQCLNGRSEYKKVDFPVIKQYINNLSIEMVLQILNVWLEYFVTTTDRFSVASHTSLNALISLCISEVSIYNNLQLILDSDVFYTIEQAMQDQLFYLNHQHQVFIPPLLLNEMVSKQTGFLSCPLLKSMNCVLSCREFEIVPLQPILRRFHAYAILGHQSILLSKLLCLDIPNDIELRLRDKYTYQTTQNNILLRKDFISHSMGINKPTAASADSFIVVYEYNQENNNDIVLYIQTKQSVLSLQSSLFNNNPSHSIVFNKVKEERSKTPMSGKDLLLYVSDCESNMTEEESELLSQDNIIVIPLSSYDKFLGSYLSQIKKHALCQSRVDCPNIKKRKEPDPYPEFIMNLRSETSMERIKNIESKKKRINKKKMK